jgi:hypothetical protein
MTTQLSQSSDTNSSAETSMWWRQLKLISYCFATVFCVSMALNTALAGTNGATDILMQEPARFVVKHKGDQSNIAINGVSLAEWTQRFWNRFMSIPINVNPAKDLTGIHCGINQSGPVWFLGAPIQGTNELSCTIPAGKVILVPAVTYINDYPCPDPSFQPASGQTLEDFLSQGVMPLIDSFTHAVELDGKLVKLRRITAGLQSFTAAKDVTEIDTCVTGSPQLGVADGQYAFIGPLSPGQHTLHIQIESPIFGKADNTFVLNIK